MRTHSALPFLLSGKPGAAATIAVALLVAVTGPGLAAEPPAPIKLSGPLVTGGNVTSRQFSPDGQWVVYRADQDIDGVTELFSVPVGGGTPVKLNDPLLAGADVNTFTISPDSSTVIYTADQDTVGADELFAVPIAGGTATRLNDPLVSGGRVSDFTLSPDGTTVVFIGDVERDEVTEIFSVPVSGGTVTKLNPPAPSTTREVLFTRLISADSSTVVFLADLDTNSVNELYSVPIGGGTAIKLNDPLPNGGTVGLFGIKLSPDGSRVVYSADQETNNIHEIFSVPIGGGTVVKLNGTLPPSSDPFVIPAIFEFQITPDGSTVVYRGTQNDLQIDELFSVPVTGGANTQLSTPGDELFNYAISADGSTVVYQTSTGGQGLDELFSVSILGGTVTQLNAPVSEGDTVGFFELSADSGWVTYTTESINAFDAPSSALFSVPIGGGNPVRLTPEFTAGSGLNGNDISPDSRFVVYSADQETAGVRELFAIPIGGGSTLKLNGPMVSGGDIGSFRIGPTSETVIYVADQETDEADELFSVSPLAVVNTAPVAADDGFNTPFDTGLSVPAPGVLANDSDTDGDTLTAVLDTTTANGVLELFADGSFNYTPNTGFSGADTFTYYANDGVADSNIVTVTITVEEANQPPLAVDDLFSTAHDTALVIAPPGVLANDSDPESDPLVAVLSSAPTNGQLTLDADGGFTYTPNAGFAGADSFTYRANDGEADSGDATVTIDVAAAPNQTPVALDDAYSTDHDTALTLPAPGVLGNDSDPDGDPLTATLVSSPANGTLSFNADGGFTYTPNTGFDGIDSFTYQASDGEADSDIATVTITVATAPNLAPVAADDAFSTTGDTALVVTAPGVLANDSDADGDTLTAALVGGPANGTLNLGGDGAFTYTPDAGFTGSDAFSYVANDGSDDSSAATVTITVEAPIVTQFEVESATGTGPILGSISGGGDTCTISQAEALLPGEVAGSGLEETDFEHGLVGFALINCVPGSSVTVSLEFPAALPEGTELFKFGPTPDDPVPHLYTMPATISGAMASYTVVDGGLGDDDLSVNGSITDPVGPGTLAAPPPPPPPPPPGSGGTAVPIPTVHEWAMVLMALLMAGAGFRHQRTGQARRRSAG